jgi:hypothetical protein
MAGRVDFLLRVNTRAGHVQVDAAHSPKGAAGGPSFSILGSDAIGVSVSNYSTSAIGETTPGKIRVRFDIQLVNRLKDVTLMPAGGTTSTPGGQYLMLFPVVTQTTGSQEGFLASGDGTAVIEQPDIAGEVSPSEEWNGDNTTVWYDFTTNKPCPAEAPTCTRWEAFPPLAPGATSAPQTVGFDVDPTVGEFRAGLLLWATLDVGGTDTLPPITDGSTGIAFGSSEMPTDNLGPVFTGSLFAVSGSSVIDALQTARARGARLLLAVPRNRMSNDDGTFNYEEWKGELEQWRTYGIEPYLQDGTILGLYVIDEPNCAACWGGRSVSQATVDDMAGYAKTIWPNIVTFARVLPGWFYPYGPPRYLDAGWANWVGPLHRPSAGETPESFRDRHTRDAQALGLGLVLGLNVLNGGDGSSGIRGTGDLDLDLNQWQMTANEVERVGKVFAAAPYACALISWRWSPSYPNYAFIPPDQLSAIRAFDIRSDVITAWGRVGDVARSRPRTSCRQR